MAIPQLVVIVFVVCCDALSTYISFKRLRDYGYPYWVKAEANALYKYCINLVGLERGVCLGCTFNIFVILLISLIFNSCFVNGIICGAFLLAAYSNFRGILLPLDDCNEKILGKPTRGSKGEIIIEEAKTD
jgi:hypothetical protein